MNILSITRRDWLKTMGVAAGGLALGLFDKPAFALESSTTTLKSTFSPNIFVHLDKEGLVKIVCHRSEMGQGVRSTFAHLFADELGASPSQIQIVQADGARAYGSQNTDGSSSIRIRYLEFRQMAAVARETLILAACKKLKLDPKDCVAQDNAVYHKTKGKLADFGELASLASSLPIVKTAKLRPEEELKYIGRDQSFIDGPVFVTGKAKYAADIRLPNTLIAVIARPLVVGSQLEKFDATEALKVPGVKKVIALPNPKKPWLFQSWGGVAVLAENTWAAMQGRSKLKLTWSSSENDDYNSKTHQQQLQQAVSEPGVTRRSVGRANFELKQAKNTLEADYFVPHLPHIPMEPPCATAHSVEGHLEIWACTQNPQAAQRTAAEVCGLSLDKVLVHVSFLGGGFGRKSKADFVAEAAYLATQVNVPVRVQWTREDDIQFDYFNTISGQKLTVGFDEKNNVIAWRHRTAFPPIGSTFNASVDTPGPRDLQQGVLDLALGIPNIRVEAGASKPGARIGWLRSVYNIFHGFAVGSFIDEISYFKKQKPIDTWLDIIGPSRKWSVEDLGIESLSNYGQSMDQHPVDSGRLKNVLRKATEISRFDEQKAKGRAVGIAAHRSFLSYVAVVAALTKRSDETLHVDEAWVVLDAGLIVNPDRAISQMEGSVIFGINLAVFGGVTFDKGKVQQSNFHNLRLLRMLDAPTKIHVELMPANGNPPAGIGEPGVPPVAPAVANALFALTGQRARQLPLAEYFGYRL